MELFFSILHHYIDATSKVQDLIKKLLRLADLGNVTQEFEINLIKLAHAASMPQENQKSFPKLARAASFLSMGQIYLT